jgi:hypothetical protein
MKIQLTRTPPNKDGYYLVKFHAKGGIHLVFVQTMLDGTPQIVADTCPFINTMRCENKVLKCKTKGTSLFFHEFPKDAWWAGPVECNIVNESTTLVGELLV